MGANLRDKLGNYAYFLPQADASTGTLRLTTGSIPKVKAAKVRKDCQIARCRVRENRGLALRTFRIKKKKSETKLAATVKKKKIHKLTTKYFYNDRL